MLAAAGTGLVLAVVARGFSLDTEVVSSVGRAAAPPAPEAVAPEFAAIVVGARGRVMEMQRYVIDPARRAAFLAAMADVREVRGRAGAVGWLLYEDVAHPDGWLEVWSVETWTDHLREVARLSVEDQAVLGRALDFHVGEKLPLRRYIAVPPHRMPVPRGQRPAA
jgi:hypothetical protein